MEAMYPYGGRQSSARVQLFEDLNGDGVFSSGEHVLSGASAQVWQGGMHQSTAKGIIVQSLEPYKAYQTTIDPASIPDPVCTPLPVIRSVLWLCLGAWLVLTYRWFDPFWFRVERGEYGVLMWSREVQFWSD